VALRIKLTAFSEEDTRDYILHRLGVAGAAARTIFTEDAIKAVYEFSRGVPRLINTICDNALLEGFLVKAETLDDQLIKYVAVDLGLNPEGGS
jgi:type II secretory pathway predicted ATPase ExeA